MTNMVMRFCVAAFFVVIGLIVFINLPSYISEAESILFLTVPLVFGGIALVVQ